MVMARHVLEVPEFFVKAYNVALIWWLRWKSYLVSAENRSCSPLWTLPGGTYFDIEWPIAFWLYVLFLASEV